MAWYELNKGSALVSGGQPVAVRPASKWAGSTGFHGHVEDVIRVAEGALEAQAIAATGVGLRFAAGDEWPAAELADPVLVNRVLLVWREEHYQVLVRVM